MMGPINCNIYASHSGQLEPVKASRPVSYTHLDVYKRQTLYSTECINTLIRINIVELFINSPCFHTLYGLQTYYLNVYNFMMLKTFVDRKISHNIVNFPIFRQSSNRNFYIPVEELDFKSKIHGNGYIQEIRVTQHFI